MSDIDTVVMDSLKALDPNRPIREADIAHQTFTLYNDGFSGFHWRIYLALRGGLRRCALDWQSVALSRTIYGLARKCPGFRIRIPQANRFGRWHDCVPQLKYRQYPRRMGANTR